MSPLIITALVAVLLAISTIVVFTIFRFGFSVVQASASSVTPSPGVYGNPSKSAESNTSPTFKFSARTSPVGVLTNVETETDLVAITGGGGEAIIGGGLAMIGGGLAMIGGGLAMIGGGLEMIGGGGGGGGGGGVPEPPQPVLFA